MDQHSWKPGTERDAIDTPALLIDLDVMERNIERMAAFFQIQASKGSPVRLRPHTKTHKCPVSGTQANRSRRDAWYHMRQTRRSGRDVQGRNPLRHPDCQPGRREMPRSAVWFLLPAKRK